MDDLISRQAFKEECLKLNFFPALIASTLKKMPTIDAVEAIKSTDEIEQALRILNIYRNSYYTEPSGTIKFAVANAINTILPLFVKCLERRTDATD